MAAISKPMTRSRSWLVNSTDCLNPKLPHENVEFPTGENVTLDNASDKQLIQQSVDGSLDAFDVLVRRYQDRLVHSLEHALGSREDALDAAQQAFVSAWSKLSAFRQEAGFYSWLYRIAMNAAVSRRRRERLSAVSLDQYIAASGVIPVDNDAHSAPDHRLEQEERAEIVRRALLLLAEEFRQPLVLKEIDGMSYEDIAAILEIPVGTVRSRLFRARREMTEHLERLFRPSEE